MREIILKPHNEEAYSEAMSVLERERRVAIVQATGTGKSYVVAKIVNEFKKRGNIIIVAPSSEILRQYRRNEFMSTDGVVFMTYSKVMHLRKDKILSSDLFGDVSLIVADELHRIGAKAWGEAFEDLVGLFPDAKVVGNTATPIRSLDNRRDMVEEEFEGNAVSNLGVVEAIRTGILPKPVYVASLYSIEEEIADRKRKLSVIGRYASKKSTKKLVERLERVSLQWEEKRGIDKILKRHLGEVVKRDGGVKVIVFTSNVISLNRIEEEAKRWFASAFEGVDVKTYRYHAKEAGKDGRFREFKGREVSDGISVLFTINKLNEGIHLNDVTAIIMMRRTISDIIYHQQIGRVLSLGSRNTPVIFDFVNNCREVWTGIKFFNGVNSGEVRGELVEHESSKVVEIFDYTEEFSNVMEEIDNRIGNNSMSLVMEEIRKAVEMGQDINKLEDKRLQASARMIMSQSRSMGVYLEYARELKQYGIVELAIIPWTEEEDRIIREYYPTEAGACNKRLHRRSREAVLARATKLGVKFETWTAEEEDILREYYPKEGKNVAKRLSEKSEGQVRNRAGKLGIRVEKRNIAWTEKEDAIIRKYYPKEGDAIVARLTGRSELAARQRAKKLGVERKAHDIFWTEEEDEIVRKYYPIESIGVAERLPNRTITAIRLRARVVGVAGGNPWTEEEDDLLREYFPQYGSAIYTRFKGRTKTAVAKRAVVLGVKYAIKVWSETEEELMRKYFKSEGYEVAKRLDNKSREQIRKKATKMGLREKGRARK